MQQYDNGHRIVVIGNSPNKIHVSSHKDFIERRAAGNKPTKEVEIKNIMAAIMEYHRQYDPAHKSSCHPFPW